MNLTKFLYVLLLLTTAGILAHSNNRQASSVTIYQQRVAATVAQMMRSYDITYIYGGTQVYSATTCNACVRCLAGSTDKAKIAQCAVCRGCSLDCSHFIHQVFNQVGLVMPYLTTRQMLQLSPPRLRKHWQLITMPHNLKQLRPLDLLVYKGHVVLLETHNGKGRGTIVHVTAGRELRGPGVALQRERQVEIARFRGPLLRILRHRQLFTAGSSATVR